MRGLGPRSCCLYWVHRSLILFSVATAPSSLLILSTSWSVSLSPSLFFFFFLGRFFLDVTTFLALSDNIWFLLLSSPRLGMDGKGWARTDAIFTLDAQFCLTIFLFDFGELYFVLICHVTSTPTLHLLQVFFFVKFIKLILLI